jgi:2,4'-dihydroxyacetophenone dioxygenase
VYLQGQCRIFALLLYTEANFTRILSDTQAKMAPGIVENPNNGANDGAKLQKNDARQPYRGEQPYGMPNDMVVKGVLDLDNTDERLWVPQAPDVWFRPLLFSTSQGYFVNILRVRKSGILSRHQHTGPVCATTLRGRWHYLEHDWWAEEGGFSFEPPGETHTLEVPEGVEEMCTLFHVTGAYIYCDPDGKAERVEDVFSKIKMARAHYEKVGLGADYVDQFIR